MPHTVTNKGLFNFFSTAISGATDLRAAVFKGSAPSIATIKDMNFLTDLTAVMTEAAAVGYTRQDLSGVALAENDASDNVTFIASAPTMTNVAVGETWVAIGYYIEAGTDATRLLVSVDIPASTLVTNGGNVTLPAFSLTVAQP